MSKSEQLAEKLHRLKVQQMAASAVQLPEEDEDEVEVSDSGSDSSSDDSSSEDEKLAKKKFDTVKHKTVKYVTHYTMVPVSRGKKKAAPVVSKAPPA